MKKTIFENIKIAAIAIILSLCVGEAHAWTSPGITPPGGNISSPLNVGAAMQIKSGSLWAGGLGLDGGLIVGGNIGVGTTSANKNIVVYGGVNNNSIIALDATGGNGYGAQISFISKTVGGTIQNWVIGTANLIGNTADFEINDITAPNKNVMTFLKSSGNVGIATTTPSEKLEVNGNIKATAFLYSSDINLKKNIQPLENQLVKVLKLQPVSYEWKADNKSDIGLIAQDVEKVFPEVVHTNKSTNLKSIDYAKLTVYLIGAIKEQQKEIEQLKSNR